MPHRAVMRTNKDTTKVRVIFNCSSKIKDGIFLNDFLGKRTNSKPNILDVILYFRKFKVDFNERIEN